MTNQQAHPQTSTMSLVSLGISQGHIPTPTETSVLATLAPGSAVLIGLEGQFKGARFLLTPKEGPDGAIEPIVAGRSPESDIYLDDVTVSRSHTLFIPNAGSFIMADAGSLNGSYVNGDRVDEAYLKSGDEIHIGKFHFAFYLGQGH